MQSKLFGLLSFCEFKQSYYRRDRNLFLKDKRHAVQKLVRYLNYLDTYLKTYDHENISFIGRTQ